MKKPSVSPSIVAVVAMVILSACGSVGLPGINLSPTQPASPAVSAPTPTSPLVAQPAGATDLLAAYQGTLENIYNTVSPSVVNIQVVQKVSASNSDPNQNPVFPFFGLPQGQGPQPQPQFQSALGSGFVW